MLAAAENFLLFPTIEEPNAYSYACSRLFSILRCIRKIRIGIQFLSVHVSYDEVDPRQKMIIAKKKKDKNVVRPIIVNLNVVW